MFESIDDDDNAKIDFEEFFKFYKDHLEQLVYEEDLEKFNPEIESLHITRWRKAVKNKVIGNEASVAAAVTSMSRERGKVEISKIMMRGDLEALKAFIDERSSHGVLCVCVFLCMCAQICALCVCCICGRGCTRAFWLA